MNNPKKVLDFPIVKVARVTLNLIYDDVVVEATTQRLCGSAVPR